MRERPQMKTRRQGDRIGAIARQSWISDSKSPFDVRMRPGVTVKLPLQTINKCVKHFAEFLPGRRLFTQELLGNEHQVCMQILRRPLIPGIETSSPVCLDDSCKDVGIGFVDDNSVCHGITIMVDR